MGLKRSVLLGFVLLFLQGSAHADYSVRQSVKQYVAEVSDAHGFDEKELLALFADAKKKQTILDAIARPAEKTWAWHEYRELFIQPKRIDQGVAFWRANEAALARAEKTYGVSAEVIVAIIGVETFYGRIMGSHRVVDALTTLTFDYPPRAKFFRGELTQFLLLAREERKDPKEPVGSYAGAMGFGQFIPSSYRAYAVDFDGDGVRDIWQNRTDAIGSVANYFSQHGWKGGTPVIVPVNGVGDELDALANQGLALTHKFGDLVAQGLQAKQELSDDEPVALFRFKSHQGNQYYVALNDFYVITRYNHSRLYALAVHELSQEILKKYRDGM